MVQKPHLPTLGVTVVIVLVAIVIYHLGFKKRG
jgi:hypothetical protein